MNGNLEGIDGMDGLLRCGALAEQGRQSGMGERTGSSWKRAALMSAAVLLQAGGFGA